MKPCKAAYKFVRQDDKDIYKGFGFRHLSDATAYYVHKNNESYTGTTTLCQSIGEALIFTAEYISDILNGKHNKGEIFTSSDLSCIWFDLPVAEDWRRNDVAQVFGYRAYSDGTAVVKFCAYDRYGIFIDSNPSDLMEHYKLLPILTLLLLKLINTDEEYEADFMEFVEKPSAAAFVILHEDFYQHYKNDDFILSYRKMMSVPTDCTESFRDKINAMLENNNDALPEKIKESITVKFPENSFRSEYIDLVPNLSSEFELPNIFHALCSAVAAGDMRAVLLYGSAGTGKTMSCKLMCREIGLPLMDTVNCSENLDEFILGKFLPEGDRIVFSESYVTKAIRYGGAVVFEEINFARPQYLSFLNSLLDDNGFVRLDNGEVVKRHENFRFFATMNIGYYGTKELNQALYNRFNAIVELNELSDEAITKMLTARVSVCEAHIPIMLNVYHRIKEKIKSGELDIVISPRNLENWARMAVYEGYITAAEKTIIPIARSERSIEEMIRKIIASNKWKVKMKETKQ